MAALKLTRSIIENIELPATKPVIRYDAEVPGFHVKVYPTGRRVFAIGYRTKAQRKATYTIGPFAPLTLTQARDLAKQVLLTVAGGAIRPSSGMLQKWRRRSASCAIAISRNMLPYITRPARRGTLSG